MSPVLPIRPIQPNRVFRHGRRLLAAGALSLCWSVQTVAAQPRQTPHADPDEPIREGVVHEVVDSPGAAPDPAAQAPQRWQGVLFRVIAPEEVAAGRVESGGSADDAIAAPIDDHGAPADAGPVQAINYLLGTIHFGDDEEPGLAAETLTRTLSMMSTLINEVDVRRLDTPSPGQHRWLPDGQSLSMLISPDSMLMARALLPQIAPETLERMKPWLVLALLEARGETLSDDTIDVRLQREAHERGLAVIHLETVESQLRALDCVPAAEHALVLDERLKAPWLLREGAQRALDHYRAGNLSGWLADVDRMLGLGEAGKAIEARARTCLLEDRNVRWLPQLIALLRRGNCYVAVGALHLPGEHGLLAGLIRAGYRIEAVPL